MPTISRDTPFLYVTAVTKDRLPVFRTDALAAVACAALDEAREFGGFQLFAYVLMPNHLHAITDAAHQPSNVLRFIKGIMSRRIINYLKEKNLATSLNKLKHEKRERQYAYTLWQHHSNVISLTSEAVLMQKVNYIHQNPVRDGIVERADAYRWLSVRCWNRSAREDEPIIVDADKIIWRVGKAQPYQV